MAQAGEATRPIGEATEGPHPRAMSVVVCTHSLARRALLDAAIASLEAQAVPAGEIIVVVDHNPELTRWAADRWHGVRVIENAQEQGLSGARNTGVQHARFALVGFLDDDARAAPDWVERMCAAHADPRVLGVGGTVTPEWETGRPGWFPPEFDWVVGCTYRGMPVAPAAVRNVIGASMSFQRDVVVDVGGFRSELGRIGSRPLGCEETELCIRAGQSRPEGHVLFDPGIRVIHLVPVARATVGYFLRRCYAEGCSKAIVANLAGSRSGLSTERAYVTRTLPAGVLGGVRESATGGGRGALGRAASIVAGLVATITGYAVTRLRRPWASTP